MIALSYCYIAVVPGCSWRTRTTCLPKPQPRLRRALACPSTTPSISPRKHVHPSSSSPRLADTIFADELVQRLSLNRPRPPPPQDDAGQAPRRATVVARQDHLQPGRRTWMSAQWLLRWPRVSRRACAKACSLMGRLRARGRAASTVARPVPPRRTKAIPSSALWALTGPAKLEVPLALSFRAYASCPHP